MKRKKDRGESSTAPDADELKTPADHNVCEDELMRLLTEDGEARRRFLKQALIAGGGLAAANLLLNYQARATTAPTSATANAAAVETSAPAMIPVTLRVNGKSYPLQLEPRVTLLDAVRERIGLTGSKKGCDRGQCGACTVLADGHRVNSCLALAAAYEGAEITTIEGLARGEELHPLQAAFIKHDGFQCGYCTPGQIMSAAGLLKEGCPAGMTVRDCMSGNICRCGAYNGIVAAIEEVRGAKA
jgi:xanthine dehydrogenase YagT iron-sulfur-binding subunit